MKIALTFDDLILHESTNSNEISNKILESLASHKIKILGFTNPISFNGKEKLISSVAHTHWLGNHTYSHLDYENTRFDKFCRDVRRGEEELVKYYSEDHGERRFFRFPWLRRGKSKSDRRKILEFLGMFNYKFVHAAFDSYDWVFERYLRRHPDLDSNTLKALGERYTEFVISHIEVTQRLAEKTYHRSIPLIGLFHWNLTNACFLDVVLNKLESRGFIFCDIDHALEDEVYRDSMVPYKSGELLMDPCLPKWRHWRKELLGNNSNFQILSKRLEKLSRR